MDTRPWRISKFLILIKSATRWSILFMNEEIKHRVVDWSLLVWSKQGTLWTSWQFITYREHKLSHILTYRLSESLQEEVRVKASRVYANSRQPWNGNFTHFLVYKQKLQWQISNNIGILCELKCDNFLLYGTSIQIKAAQSFCNHRLEEIWLNGQFL